MEQCGVLFVCDSLLCVVFLTGGYQNVDLTRLRARFQSIDYIYSLLLLSTIQSHLC